MVSLSVVEASNSRISSTLPHDLVAVFVGATNGIGETTLKQFAKHASKPRLYFIGRSQEAGDRITTECKTLNVNGEYIFIKADVSLIHVVDEKRPINILFMSQGTLITHTKTSEDLHLIASLAYYSRARFILNLLPLLRRATGLRRVVSVFAGGKEGPIDTNDFQGWKLGLSARGHASSLITLSHEVFAKKAPEVSFVHDFPGPVKSGIGRGAKSAPMLVLKAVLWVIGPFIYIPNQESGERHLYFATSARYPASASEDGDSGVPLQDGVDTARGTDGKAGSGIYSIDWDGESAGKKVEETLEKLRKEDVTEKLWNHTEEEFERILGQKA
ncbi:hypothetical protein CPB84DRAFT_1768254 [Gymnopilus junonius]|uniref:Uncharacterized protein n=1 Tax=Gymnopilus junonius TaxID=109634 RepID=A0A9P5NXP8_GYMJU|nr:hypothetical protein CPB84DRAFT_1768254 [Gymnopilus junonius]